MNGLCWWGGYEKVAFFIALKWQVLFTERVYNGEVWIFKITTLIETNESGLLLQNDKSLKIIVCTIILE